MLLGLSLFAMAIGLLPSVAAATCSPASHGSILIRSDADFTAANGVVSGQGTAADPFLFANLKLNDLRAGYGLKVDNSKGKITKYFNVQCVQSSFASSPPKGAKLIWIVGIHTSTTVSDVAANSGEAAGSTGVQIDTSSGIALDTLSIEKFGHDGVQLNGADHVTLLHSKLKAMHNAVTVKDSHDITIGDSCDLSAAHGTCDEFTYDDGRGVYILNSHDVLVQYVKTNADDTAGTVLDGSGTYGITLSHGVSNGNGPICPQSNGGVPTGERVDYQAGIAVLNGAHDINVKDWNSQGNWVDIMNGGNGIYHNPCTGLTESLKPTPPGGANLDFNGNCWHIEFGFDPEPTKNC